MADFSADESEAILEAAARGRASEGSGPVGDLFVALHSPGEAAGEAPAPVVAARGVTGRIARRTAVAATAAVLGLAGAAAAATGAATLLDSDTPAVAEYVEEADDSHDDGAGGEGHDDDGRNGEESTPSREIEGVDPSDGLDDEELELACEGAENHGHYVSMVARDRVTEHDGNHGDRLSDAAESDCGKPDRDADDDSEAHESDDDDADEDESDDGEKPGKGKGHGSSKGKGHSEGKNHGHGHQRD